MVLKQTAATDAQQREFLPEAYRLPMAERGPNAPQAPRNVFIEVTNHCNLLCETCPRTFVSYESPKTLGWDEFLAVVEQFPEMERAVLHGIGEPLLNKDVDRMVAHLRARGVYVLFNTNATLLNADWSRRLIASGLNELRVSIDGADAKTYALIRGAPLFHKVVANLKGFIDLQRDLGAERPVASLWMTGMRENIRELPDVVRLAAYMGVTEVYLQRMVYLSQVEQAPGMLDAGHALFGATDAEIEALTADSERLATSLGVRLRAAGATTPTNSLRVQANPHRPWSACARPWSTAYVTANGNCLPCCISPFATTRYDTLKLGNLFERPFSEIWNDPAYQAWRTQLLSDTPHEACAGCGVHWSL
jgi:radical SAM protein with 4Fe4S-binding SPASM domain